MPVSVTDLCRKSNQRKQENFSKSFQVSSNRQTARDYQVPPWQESMCPWVSLSESSSDLHSGQRWEKSASPDSHTNFTWDDVSRVQELASLLLWKYTAYVSHILILNINLPASHNSHLCLISVVRLEDIGNFSYRKYLLPNSNTWLHMEMKNCRWRTFRRRTVLQSTTFLCVYMTDWIIIMSKGLYFITQNIEKPSLGYYFSLTAAVEIILKDDCWPKVWPFLHIKVGIKTNLMLYFISPLSITFMIIIFN